MADAAWSLSEERCSDRLANGRVARVLPQPCGGEFDEPSVNRKPVQRLLHEGASVAAFRGEAASPSSGMRVRCWSNGEQVVRVEAGPMRTGVASCAPPRVMAGVINLEARRDGADPQLVSEPMDLAVATLEPQRPISACPSLSPDPAQRLGVHLDPGEQPFRQRPELAVNDQWIAVAPPPLVMGEAPPLRLGLLPATRNGARAFIDSGLGWCQCTLLSLLLVVRRAQPLRQRKSRAVGERAELRGFHTQRLA